MRASSSEHSKRPKRPVGPGARIRTATALTAVALLAFGSTTVLAQEELLSIAPARFRLDVQHRTGERLDAVSIGYERAIPVANLLPQVSPDSFVEFVRVQAGIRVDANDKIDFRTRATVAAFGIQKMPWAAALSLIDVDASGLVDYSADWLAFGLGPGIDFGKRRLRVVARVLARGAVNSTRFGERVFPGLGTPAGETRHTLKYGLEGTAGLVSSGRGSLLVRYSLNRYAIDAGIEGSEYNVRLGLFLSRKVELAGTYELVELQLGDSDGRTTGLGLGLRYTPAETY